MEKPLVSVVMPVYNVENYVKESIYSILSQTYVNFEFIIINDGSTDNTAEIADNIHDKRIIFLSHSENKGNYIRRNEGCRLAQGKYICVMDGDDIAMPERIEKQVEIIEKDPSLLALGTAFTFPNGYICRKPCNYDYIKVMLLFNNMFLHPSLIIRKDVLESIGYYNENYYYSSDYDLVCKIALQGNIINIPDILMKYRLHEKQISSAHNIKQTEFANQIRLDYIERCGFRLTREEMDIFTLMITRSNRIKELNIDIHLIINNLKEQNQQLKYFNTDIFDLFWENIAKNLV
ncbi:glycosyl transferase [Bacteroidia bacterium]|nr:glycosyl transferase [Bacteroidia bacterium]